MNEKKRQKKTEQFGDTTQLKHDFHRIDEFI